MPYQWQPVIIGHFFSPAPGVLRQSYKQLWNVIDVPDSFNSMVSTGYCELGVTANNYILRAASGSILAPSGIKMLKFLCHLPM